MKIVMFGQKQMPSREGGIEVVVQELSVRMARRGYQVICCNRGRRKQTDIGIFEGVRCKSVPAIDKKGLSAVTAGLSAAVYSVFSGADLVHIHAEGPAFFSWIPKLFGKKVIVTVHGLDWQREKWKQGFGSKFIRWGEIAAVRFADKIIVLSRNLQRYFQDTYDRETVWIPNGVSRPEIVSADLIFSKYGLKKDSYILFLGRLVPEKGVHYLLEAFQQIHTDKKLVIAGASSDTNIYVNQLMACGDERIIFTGFVQGRELEELYSNAYIYVLPSDLEGMPLSLMEAMSYGCCCLTSDIPECTEVTGKLGIIFRRGNVADLRKKLQMLCNHPETVKHLGAESRAYICGRFHWDDVTEKTLELYHACIDHQ